MISFQLDLVAIVNYNFAYKLLNKMINHKQPPYKVVVYKDVFKGLLLYFSFSQIWLNLHVNHHHFGYITK